MTRLVEVNADAMTEVRVDLAAVRDAIQGQWGSLRARAWALGVPTGAFDEVLEVAARLDSHVLPVVDLHLARARALEALRYGGRAGMCIPVVDAEVSGGPTPFAQQTVGDGASALTWAATGDAEVEADAAATRTSDGIGEWFSERWDDVSDAVADGAEWVTHTAEDAWVRVVGAGGAIGDWWETTTADLGAWVDENLADVRTVIGRHVALLRFTADMLRVIGWVLVAIGAVLTVGLAIVGGMGGAAIGAVFGFGVGAAPAGGAGAAAGVASGLKVVGGGFALLSVADFLDVAADWAEGKIDGQDLVQLGSLELGLAATSLLGFGAFGKLLQLAVKHLPASWRKRAEEALGPTRDEGRPAPASRDPFTEPSRPLSQDARPRGRRTVIGAKEDADVVRSLRRENEAADLFARQGYDIEQNPTVSGLKNPDYLIEGHVFDAYAPETPRVRNIADYIDDKVRREQTRRVVLVLDDSPVSIEAMVNQLHTYPIPELKEVFVVRGGMIKRVYP